jgi:hypothetical protein
MWNFITLCAYENLCEWNGDGVYLCLKRTYKHLDKNIWKDKVWDDMQNNHSVKTWNKEPESFFEKSPWEHYISKNHLIFETHFIPSKL